jgi:glucosyl-3-phosphoglycerate synthase
MRADVRRWLRTNTSTGEQWCARRLAAAKRDNRISVVLPAHNEAETVGDIVTALRRELVERVPLIDQLLVVDSGSEDDTAEVARRAGAEVVRQDALLPRWGNQPGKGEALWKSLLATHGDIVAFIDADLREFDPAFAVGLVGPLLADPRTQFVKAFYDRPLANGDTVMPAGGGRVTELLARPLLNLHWPELAGFVQPLAGEYAARRHLLERLPFVAGYGVEIGMLIDVLELVGLSAMAQVDLGRRQHRNSDDAALGRMAAQVYLALVSRLERHDRLVQLHPVSTSLTQFERAGATFVPLVNDVGITERPPMITVAEYGRRRVSESV